MPRRRTRFEYTDRKVRRRGLRDGRPWRWSFWPPVWPFRSPKSSIPDVGQTQPAAYELAIREATEHDMGMLAERWKSEDRDLKTAFCRASTELDAASGALAKEQGEADRALATFEGEREQYFALPSPPLSHRWAIVWLVLLGLSEFYLNAVVFEILGSGRLETYIAALAIGVGLPVGAHVFGSRLRQETKSSIDQIVVMAIPVVFFVALSGLAYLRARFLEAVGIDELLGISLTATQATIVFLVLNVAIFFIAFLVSYEAAHPDASLYKTRRKRYEYARERYSKEAHDAEGAVSRVERASLAYQSSRHQRQKRFEQLAEEARTLRQTGEHYVRIYREANLAARADSRCPECFKVDPLSVDIPVALRSIDWDCEAVSGNSGRG